MRQGVHSTHDTAQDARHAPTTAPASPWPDMEAAYWQLEMAHRAITEQYAILRGLRELLPAHFERTCWELDTATEELAGWREWARRRYASDEGERGAGAGEPPF